MRILCLALLLVAPLARADWDLEPEQSRISFVSVKRGEIASVQHFEQLPVARRPARAVWRAPGQPLWWLHHPFMRRRPHAPVLLLLATLPLLATAALAMHDGAVFPWRSGNRFALLVDGPVYFPRMLAAIEQAERQVELELYLIEDGDCASRLLDALLRAVARGVRVRCLFDAFGSLKLSAESRQRLVAAGVELRLYNRLGWRRGLRNLFRDHRKLLLVDDRAGYVGGAGATDEFWNPRAPERSWHEVMVEFSGPVLADWRELFEFQWRRCVEWHFWWPTQAPKAARLPPSPAQGDGMARVAYAAARQHRDILRALLRSLAGARERVWLATPYFLPTWKVRRALVKAARRGVDVRLLLCGQCTDHPPVRFAGQRYYPRLLRAGVRIFEYQPRFSHMKMVLVDGWVTVGSCNFDHWNLRWNLEANLEILDRQMTRMAAACLQADFQQSREITLQDWYARPLLKRIYQRLWGMLDRLVLQVLERNQ